MALIGIGSALVTPANAAESLQNTEQFLRSKFSNGQFIEGLTAGVPDYGFSLEGLIQRKALGERASTLSPAVTYLLLDSAKTGLPNSPTGYLFNDGHLRLGLAGKWAFASVVVGAENQKLRRAILDLALTKIDGTGDVASDANANTYDRAWLVLGLKANGFAKQAQLLALNVARHQMPDGGFNDGFDTSSSSTDGTGITLQALGSVLPGASPNTTATIKKSEAKAVRYLQSHLSSDHYVSYGDSDVNGTAYAVMGLLAAGEKPATSIKWLRQQLTSDGGVATPWSNGSGDVFATAQSISAILGRSYVQLISGKGGKRG